MTLPPTKFAIISSDSDAIEDFEGEQIEIEGTPSTDDCTGSSPPPTIVVPDDGAAPVFGS